MCVLYLPDVFAGYLRHLFVAGEITALRLFSLHNIAYYLQLAADMRAAIEKGTFRQLLSHHRDLAGAGE